MPVTQKEFDNFLPLYKSLKNYIVMQGGDYEKYDVDCASNYLYISLLSLIIFLL